MKKSFSPSRAAASLSAQPHRRPGLPPRRSNPPRLGPAQRALALLPRAAPVAAPRRDRLRKLSPRGDHVPASPAARQPRPDTAPTRPPSPAGAHALAHSRPRFLFSPPEPRASRSALATPAAPPAISSSSRASFSDS